MKRPARRAPLLARRASGLVDVFHLGRRSSRRRSSRPRRAASMPQCSRERACRARGTIVQRPHVVLVVDREDACTTLASALLAPSRRCRSSVGPDDLVRLTPCACRWPPSLRRRLRWRRRSAFSFLPMSESKSPSSTPLSRNHLEGTRVVRFARKRPAVLRTLATRSRNSGSRWQTSSDASARRTRSYMVKGPGFSRRS
jgi:hypothetical protein